jgi:hypothetical protein
MSTPRFSETSFIVRFYECDLQMTIPFPLWIRLAEFGRTYALDFFGESAENALFKDFSKHRGENRWVLKAGWSYAARIRPIIEKTLRILQSRFECFTQHLL